MAMKTTAAAVEDMDAKEVVLSPEQKSHQAAGPSSMCIIALLEQWLQSPVGAMCCDKAGFVPLAAALARCPSLRALAGGSPARLAAAVAAGPAAGALELDEGRTAVRFRGLLERVRVAAEQHVATVGTVSLDSLMRAGPVVDGLSGVLEVSEQMQVLKDALNSSCAVLARGQWVMPTGSDLAAKKFQASTLSADAPVFRPSWQPVDILKGAKFVQDPKADEVSDESGSKHTAIETELKVDAGIAKFDKLGSRNPSAADGDVASDTVPHSMMAEPDSEPEAEASPREDNLAEMLCSHDVECSTEGPVQCLNESLPSCATKADCVLTSSTTASSADCDDKALPADHKSLAEETSVPSTPERSTGAALQAVVHEEAAPTVPELTEAATDIAQAAPISWAAQQRLRRLAAGKAEGQEVVRAVKSILNKLTVEKFAQLSQQLLSIEFRTKDHIETLIREVFEKATMQHHFVDMYADLCVILHEFFTGHPATEDPKFTFKRGLLNQCQASFERNLVPPGGLEDLDPEDRVIQETKYKTRMVGNIRLVGALLTRRLIPPKVMLAIFDELLGEPTAESLEAAAVLIAAVGPAFDSAESGLRPVFTGLFLRMKDLASSSSCEARARCLLKDVLELRAGGWQSRRPKRQEQPTTLQAVAARATAEEPSAAARPRA